MILPFFALALPLAVSALPPHSAITSLLARQSSDSPTPAQGTDAYPDPARWAAAAYCNKQVGDSVNNAQVVGIYGDGDDVPYAYVAWHSDSNRVVVSHEGTDPTKLESIANDVDLPLSGLDGRLSGCLDSNALIHDGFQNAWTQTADDIFSTVQDQLNQHSGAGVIVTGHSLGAAIASLDYAYLKCKLSGTDVQSVVFGQPRTGNLAYANSMPSYHHIVNGADPIPNVPPRADTIDEANDGYWHAPGEVWQKDADESDSAIDCPGEENENCSTSSGSYNIIDHLGVYFGVTIEGTLNC